MKFIASVILSATSICAIATGLPNPATAAPRAKPAKNLSKEEQAVLLPIQNAIDKKDWATAQRLLPAAVASAQSAAARYAVGRFQLETGLGINDVRMQAEGLDNLVASGQVPAADLPTVYRNQGVLAKNAGDKAKAEAAFAKMVEVSPNDPEALITLAQIKNDLKKPQEALQLISRAIEMKRTAGQSVDESWYKYALKLAYEGRQNPALLSAATKLSSDLLAAYPTKENWRDAMLIYLDENRRDAATGLDVLRLMRAGGALAGERDWYDLADSLYRAGNFGETKSVLAEGTAKRMFDPKKASFAELLRLNNARLVGDRESLTAESAKAMAAGDGKMALKIGDALYGYGEYEKAINLYRAALSKGGIDSNLVNTRMAMAMLASGNRAGAEAAFKALGGSRAPLGAFWLWWLAHGG